MSVTFLHIITVVCILLFIVENTTSSYCQNSVFCTQSPYYWCCPKDTQCGMNMGKCYSKTYTDNLLIGGGVAIGVLVLICLGFMGYCIRSHLADEKKANRKTNTVFKFTNPVATNINRPIVTEQSSEYDKGMTYLKTTEELLQRIQTDNHSQV